MDIDSQDMNSDNDFKKEDIDLLNKKKPDEKIEDIKINENKTNIVRLDDGLELPLPDFKCEVNEDN